MPILICLKEPQINLIVEGGIKDTPEATKEWDEIFHNQILMTKRQGGLNMIIPLLRECNIAFLQEVTKEEIEEQKKEAEKRHATRERQQGSLISSPAYAFPGGRSRH